MTQPIPETPPDFDRRRIVERPDGFYGQSKDGGREFGPFDTLIAAMQDMQRVDGEELEPGESVAEAESEIGSAEWVDPETGTPAEESVPRIEDH